MIQKNIRSEFLIIGSGAAGLSAALHAGRHGRVLLLTKDGWNVSSSYWAQGGIAAVLQEPDSYQSHLEDTLEAGRHFCDIDAVEILVKEGAREVRRYINMGMAFDRVDGSFDLGLEGGHSNRRVLHANGAATGKALIDFLRGLVDIDPNIHVVENAFVYELLSDGEVCRGAVAYQYGADEILAVESRATILAAGGYAGLFKRSTNPHTSTGDGAWLAHKAGAKLQDLEFVQFHPTAFYSPAGETFLISEAVRGEGAHLYNQKGERFMADTEQQELAPRDVVSREIFRQIRNQENNFVYLDVRHLNINKIRSHFSDIFEKIEANGINIEQEGIPIAPAAHYCIGGITTDLNAQTSIQGLYACGEAAVTGVHGANRLASNSLLECLVFSNRAVSHAANAELYVGKESPLFPIHTSFAITDKNEKYFANLRENVSIILARYAGVYRDKEGLEYALDKIEGYLRQLPKNIGEYYSLRSEGLLQLTHMMITAALQREESRGVHIRSDFPESWVESRHISFQNQTAAL